MATLGDALAELGIDVLAETSLGNHKVRISFRAKGRRGSVIFPDTATADDVFEALYAKLGEILAEDLGVSRERGRAIALETLKAARARKEG